MSADLAALAYLVAGALFIMALLAGLQKAFVSSGNPLNVMVVRKGSTSELTGPFPAENFPTLTTLPGIASDSHGQPMVSGETVVVIVDEPLLPACTETEVGEAASVKAGVATAVTVSETLVVCVMPSPEPVTVIE